MDRRYELFEGWAHGISASANRKFVAASSSTCGFFYIAVFIDELADLDGNTLSRRRGTTLCRLAQMARATGIHLVVARSTPSTDVITGLIKANSRPAFLCRIRQPPAGHPRPPGRTPDGQGRCCSRLHAAAPDRVQVSLRHRGHTRSNAVAPLADGISDHVAATPPWEPLIACQAFLVLDEH